MKSGMSSLERRKRPETRPFRSVSGLEGSQRAQSRLCHFGIRIVTEFLQSRNALLIAAAGQHARQADLLVFRGSLQRVVQRLANLFVARQFDQVWISHAVVSGGV